MKRMWTEREIRSKASNEAKKLIEDGLTENAKPIYCHPIEIRLTSAGYNLALTSLIFTNDGTPMTLASFKAYLIALAIKVTIARIMTSGGINDKANSKILINSFLYVNASNGTFGFYGLSLSGDTDVISFSMDDWNTVFEGCTFNDGVNKIN